MLNQSNLRNISSYSLEAFKCSYGVVHRSQFSQGICNNVETFEYIQISSCYTLFINKVGFDTTVFKLTPLNFSDLFALGLKKCYIKNLK